MNIQKVQAKNIDVEQGAVPKRGIKKIARGNKTTRSNKTQNKKTMALKAKGNNSTGKPNTRTKNKAPIARATVTTGAPNVQVKSDSLAPKTNSTCTTNTRHMSLLDIQGKTEKDKKNVTFNRNQRQPEEPKVKRYLDFAIMKCN